MTSCKSCNKTLTTDEEKFHKMCEWCDYVEYMSSPVPGNEDNPYDWDDNAYQEDVFAYEEDLYS